MNLPFTPEEFFAVFVRYNQSVWPAQLVLNAAALLAAAMLFRSGVMANRTISLILALFWGWMSTAYHFMFFTRINPVAWLFGLVFLAGGAAFLWLGIIRPRLRFGAVGGSRGALGWLFVVFALAIYPAIGYALGHRYPAAPTFGLPCPTTIFTIGLLLFAEPPAPRAVFIVPLLWTAVGSLAAFWLGVFEDLALVVAGVIGLAAALFSYPPAPPLLRESRS
jgi:hypothetical protein